jgi:hypothetical protein
MHILRFMDIGENLDKSSSVQLQPNKKYPTPLLCLSASFVFASEVPEEAP